MGMLSRNECDVGLADFFLTVNRAEAADFSPILLYTE